MKKYYSLFLFWSLLTGLSTSCSDDNKKDPYLPTPPQVSIGNPSGQTTCLPGETIELKAILNNPLQTTFQWQLNKKTVSTDSIYRFTSQDPGSFEIILTATNQDGKDSDTLFLKVNGNRFAISDLKNWTGNGENTSVFAIQWVTGEHLQEPADQEVFSLPGDIVGIKRKLLQESICSKLLPRTIPAFMSPYQEIISKYSFMTVITTVKSN